MEKLRKGIPSELVAYHNNGFSHSEHTGFQESRFNDLQSESFPNETVEVHVIDTLIGPTATDVSTTAEEVEEEFQGSLPIYLHEMGRRRLLTFDEEISLAKQIEAGKQARKWLAEKGIPIPQKKTPQEEFEEAKRNPQILFQSVPAYSTEVQAKFDEIEKEEAARVVLTESNLRLVVSVARRYINRGVDLQDLIQEGNIGLTRAVEKYDWKRGFRFSTYATWWIRQAVSRSLADQARTIRVPVHMVEAINKYVREVNRLQHELGRDPTDEEVGVAMETTAQRVREIIRILPKPISLESSVGDDGDAVLSDFIEDEHAEDMDEAANRVITRQKLDSVLQSLPPREQRVLELRFGLEDDRLWTLSEIGAELGVTRERIRQLEAKALRRLRHPKNRLQLRELSE